MLRKIFFFLAIFVAVLLVFLWIYFPSFSRYHELRLHEEQLTKKIQEIDEKIKDLNEERGLLQNDVNYIERVIRDELGLVKPGEIVYEFIAKNNPFRKNPEADQIPATDVSKPSLQPASSSEKKGPLKTSSNLPITPSDKKSSSSSH